ncbi:hypothetical protein AMECASPLE_026631 [Ameca splendens]|uniref:Uncharacterized protein n=1 Tax=Ameca splendens TaxID=208324 RepID=A0ABV0XTV7_9TELE
MQPPELPSTQKKTPHPSDGRSVEAQSSSMDDVWKHLHTITVTHRGRGGRQRRLDDVDDPVHSRNVPLQQQPLVHQFTALTGNHRKPVETSSLSFHFKQKCQLKTCR